MTDFKSIQRLLLIESPQGGSFTFKELMPVIEMDEDEYMSSDFSDDTLRTVLDWFGPQVKDALLLPRDAIKHADRVAVRA